MSLWRAPHDICGVPMGSNGLACFAVELEADVPTLPQKSNVGINVHITPTYGACHGIALQGKRGFPQSFIRHFVLGGGDLSPLWSHVSL